MPFSATAFEHTISSASSSRRWLVSLAFAAVLQGLVFTILLLLYSSQPSNEPLRFAVAQELAAPELDTKNDNAWQALELPNKLCRRDCSSNVKLYRLTIDRTMTREDQALYVKMYDGSLTAYLNGQLLGQTGSMETPVADMTYQPAYFDIPTAFFADDTNTLDIIVASLVTTGGRLTAPFLGDREPLRSAYNVAHGLSVDSLGVINGILLMFLFAAVLLYFAADHDYLFIWFSLLLVFAIVRNLNVLFPEWPASMVARNAFYLCSTLGVLLSSGGFISRLIAKHPSRTDSLLLLSWIPLSLMIVAGLLVDVSTTWALAVRAIQVLTVALSGALLWRFAAYSKSLPVLIQGSIFGLLGAALTLMLHDAVGSSGSRLLLFQTSNLASLPLVLSFCIILAHRYRDYLLSTKHHNRQLKAAVTRKEAELNASFEHLSDARAQKVLAEERLRIMQDMHDGVGGRLAVLLQRLRLQPGDNQPLTGELQSSLNDLRLIIDSLDVVNDENLAFALGALRQRVEPWLNESDIDLDWQVDVTTVSPLGPERTLTLYRIVQEALNNVVRHSNATSVCICIDTDSNGEHLNMLIADDGDGFDDVLIEGRGIANMRRRAESLRCALRTSASGQGATISLAVPLMPDDLAPRE